MIPTSRTRPPRLEVVRRRLDRWRHTRRHARAPLPPPLWTAAVALVPEYGLYRTARGLRLDYGTLKRHVAAAGNQERRAGVPPGFVELPVPPPPAREGWVMEIDGGSTTIRFRLTGVAITDLAHFTRLVVGTDA